MQCANMAKCLRVSKKQWHLRTPQPSSENAASLARLRLGVDMLATGGKISVLVVDGNYSALHELGFPLAAMQVAGVQLGQACWDLKQSTSGMSVSFFWPSSGQTQLSSTLKTSLVKKD